MDTLLSEKDFRGIVNVAGTEQTIICEELCRFIQQREPRVLRAVLGGSFYKAFFDGATAEDHAQRWEELWNGVEWTSINGPEHWEGLRLAAACYVYFYYMRHLVSLTTTSGEKIPQADNATPAQTHQKSIDAWTEMNRILKNLRRFLSYRTDDDGVLMYPEWAQTAEAHYFTNRSVNRYGI